MARVKTMHVPPQCTADEFEAAISYFGLTPITVQRVRRVLVDGEAPKRVAEQDGVTYPALLRAVKKVKSKVQELRGMPQATAVPQVELPPGWEQATFVAPKEFIEETRKRLAQWLSTGVRVS